MNKWENYRANLEKNISQLSHSSKLEFVIDICQRLLPDYKSFVIKHNWGDYQLLSDSLDYCVRYSNLEKIDKENTNKLIKRIDLLMPDTEDFGDIEASFALNASAAVLETLEFITDKSDQHILNIASYMYDTIDFQVQNKYKDLTTEEIDNHSMLIDEMNLQIKKTKKNA